MPSNVKLQLSFTGNKLSSRFNIKDKTKFAHKHDRIYLGSNPETMFNNDYTDETKSQISERV